MKVRKTNSHQVVVCMYDMTEGVEVNYIISK